MKRNQGYISRLIMAGLGMAMAACSDDFDINRPNYPLPGQGVVVYVPQMTDEAVTRATEPSATRSPGEVWGFDNQEATISKLYFFAYSDATGVDPVREKLTDGAAGIGEFSEYTGYNVSVPVGEYRMYVVANYDLDDSYAAIDESTLKTLKVEDVYSLTSSSGLPMSCSTLQVKNSVTGNYETPAKITVSTGSQSIKADLKFAVSKVRATLLNDLDPSRTVTANESKVTNVYDKSYIFTGQGNFVGTKGDATLSGSYYAMPSFTDEHGQPLTVETVSVDALTPKTLDTTAPWAWQATTYVGEYLFGESTPAATQQPTVTIPMSEGSASKEVSATGLVRSTFYDVVGTPNGKFFVNVQPWEPVIMAFALHGAYFLHLDRTDIAVMAGRPTEITYETNGELDFSGNPTYNDEDIYTFSYSPDDKKISVSLSPTISKEECEAIKQTDDWKHIRIKSGTLVKYIEVTDLIYKEYIEIDEQTVTVDVSELIGSGTYYGDLILPIRTNNRSFTIEKADGWDLLATGDEAQYGTQSLMLQDPDGVNFTSIDPLPTNVTDNKDGTFTIDMSGSTTGVFNLRLRYSGLNEGRDYWKKQHVLGINIIGTETDESGTDVTASKPIAITVVPKADKYKIHVKTTWDKTHIYIYQCLQFPADMSYYCDATHQYDNYKKLEGKPVGARNNGSTIAALEYSFTGALAFKGWELTGDNSPTQSTTLDNGFYYFNTDPESWEGRQTGWEKHYNDFDFCYEYRESSDCDCGDCKTNSGKMNRAFPGIRMQRENVDANGHGWYYFELSGVATPGRTLIIFTSDHGGGAQYPASGAGVALFDYPSREGWIDITDSGDKKFHPENPDGTPTNPTVAVYDYAIHGSVFSAGTDWESKPMKDDDKDGIWTLGPIETFNGNFGISYRKNGSQTTWFDRTTVTYSGNGLGEADGNNWSLAAGTYTFTYDANNKKLTVSGESSGAKYLVVRVKDEDIYPDQDYLYTWTDGTHQFGDYGNSKPKEGVIDGYRYWKVESASEVSSLDGVIFKNDKNEGDRKKEYGSSSITKETSQPLLSAYGASYMFTVDASSYISASYNGKYVNVRGAFNNNSNNGKVPEKNGGTKHQSLSIGTSSFKVKVYDGTDDIWYSTGGSINQNEWIQISGNNSNEMTINGASSGDKFDVEWDYNKHIIRVTKSN